MEKYFLKNHIQEVESNFNISNIDSNFKDYQSILKSDLKQEKLFLNNCNFNQAKTLNFFIQLLYKKFGDSLLIDSKFMQKITIENRNNNDNFIAFICFCSGAFIKFAIDNYIYYLQFGKNPFFDDSSYITTEKIYKFDDNIIYKNLQNKYFLKEYFAGQKNMFNINDCIDDLYNDNCNCEMSAIKLYDYFIENCYKNESIRAFSKNERISLINDDNIKSNIFTITGDEII